MAKKKKENQETKAPTLLDDLHTAIEGLCSRFWEAEEDIRGTVGFEVAEVYTLSRIIKREGKENG